MGGRNALSVVRSLGRMGVPVHVLGSRWSVRVAASRYARKLPFPRGEGPWKERMLEFLLGPASLPVRGAVLLACNDPPIELLAEHREALLPHYRLDACHPPAQLAMLDKLATYRAAAAADVPTPRFWEAAGEEDLEALRGDLRYPLIVKPTSSAAFQSAFGGKHFRVSSFDEARRAVRSMREAGLAFLLVEFVPGGDGRYASSITWLDEDGEPAFHFTTRVIRRNPPGKGDAVYRVAEHVPGLAEPALRLVRHVGLRGIANVEFKIDPRDGVPKLIECNARFTTSNGLLEASGLDLARWVYRRAVGIPQEAPGPFRLGVRMRDPGGDFAAYRHLARRGELDFAGWLRTLRPSRPFWFRWDDPMPSVAYGVHRALRAARRGLRVGRDLPRRSGVIPGPSAARGRGEPTPHDDPGPA
jgi:predicted ATP-grasp superfamily ATP-dependent carboligase